MVIYSVAKEEKLLIEEIKRRTEKGNIDNISRTVLYNEFYMKHKEIIWACLASFVSRNAGWNMTDLEGEIFSKLIPKQYREILYLTYERANWLIFSDAYPQLLLYEASKRVGRPLFHLLKFLHVSRYMEKEWTNFWNKQDIERLCTALIVNEQHIIQMPVIEDPYYHDKVFGSLPFVIEDLLHFSTVIFPTLDGRLYGFSVHGFTKVKNRIALGKRLAWLLFTSKEKKPIQTFAAKVEHTGSRFDYEQFIQKIDRKRTPALRETYPVINHHRSDFSDWYNNKTAKKVSRYMEPTKIIKKYELTEWYYKKQRQLEVATKLEQGLLRFFREKLNK